MWLLIANSLLLGLALAMDAFSVSVANGLDNPHMSKGRHAAIAVVFGLFQMAMPMIGWVLVVTVAEQFAAFDRCVPYIALVLLTGIGIKMIVDSAKEIRREKGRQAIEPDTDCSATDTVTTDTVATDTVTTAPADNITATDNGANDTTEHTMPPERPATPKRGRWGVWALLVQALATSIDALSVGFTIADLGWAEALLSAGIIGIVTVLLCLLGVALGRKAGGRFAGKAGIVGGIILIVIGIEIVVSSLL